VIARSASSVASTVGAVAAGERGLGLDERGGLRALVIGFCGSLASCPPAGFACASQDNSQFNAGLNHTGRRKHLADSCVSRHSAQAAFEAACGQASTVHMHRSGGASLVGKKVHTETRGCRAAYHFGPTSTCNKGKDVGKSLSGGESTIVCPPVSAGQGGWEPPVEHTQQVKKYMKAFLQASSFACVIRFSCVGQAPAGP
jgi:hypothetical protein